ncbi:MAG: hypothetical protein HY907_14035 [Deltaproteobacteria bacterium]|nr:hypothetical protein [Deltaproteobacteria bacterium]
MGLQRWLGKQLARTAYARRAIAEQADLSAFRKPPSGRLLAGLILIGSSFLIAWPLIAVFGALTVHYEEPLIILIGGPAAYAASWLVWSSGMLLAGAESTRHGNIFLKWLVRRLVEKSTEGTTQGAATGSPETPPAPTPEASTSTSSSTNE